MATSWFYEYQGKRVGPVPASTIRHLAAHAAIHPQTRLWRGDAIDPVLASSLKDLFRPQLGTEEAQALAESMLEKALDNECADNDVDLSKHTPPIHALFGFGSNSFLLSYTILGVSETPERILRESTTTKKVSRIFECLVAVELCDRPSTPTSVAEIRQLQPGRRDETAVFIAKQFVDESWIFLYEDLCK